MTIIQQGWMKMNTYSSKEFLEQKRDILWGFRSCVPFTCNCDAVYLFYKTMAQYFPGVLWEYFFEMSACILEQLQTTVGS